MNTNILARHAAASILLASTGIAHAATNLIANGSFEAGLSGWTLGGSSDKYVPVAISYGAAKAYPIGAFGEAVLADDAVTLSPDAAGVSGAYFVSDRATNQSLDQQVFLKAGSYDIGFDVYAPLNGYRNKVDAQFSASIAGVRIANYQVSSQPATQWQSYTGTAKIGTSGNYLTSFVFNTAGFPAKDVVIDRVFIIANKDDGGTIVPGVPEPEAWAMMLMGLAMVGSALRRRPQLSVVAS